MSQPSESPKPPAPRGAARPFSRPAPARPARPEAPRPPSDRTDRASAPRPFAPPARRAAPAIPPSQTPPYVPNNEPDLTRLSAPMPDYAHESPAMPAEAYEPLPVAPMYETPAMPAYEAHAFDAPVAEVEQDEAPAESMSDGDAAAAAALDAAEIAAAPFDSVDLTPEPEPMLPSLETSWGAAGYEEPASVDELLFGEGALDGYDTPRDPFADADADGLPLGLSGGSALDDALPLIEAEAHASTEPDPFASSHDEPDALASEPDPFPFAPRTQADDVADRLEALAARVRAGELDVSVALPDGGDESALAATLLAIVRLRG